MDHTHYTVQVSSKPNMYELCKCYYNGMANQLIGFHLLYQWGLSKLIQILHNVTHQRNYRLFGLKHTYWGFLNLCNRSIKCKAFNMILNVICQICTKVTVKIYTASWVDQRHGTCWKGRSEEHDHVCHLALNVSHTCCQDLSSVCGSRWLKPPTVKYD